MDVLEFLRFVNVVSLGLLLPPLVILGWRRRNPGIFALVIFIITGALGTYEEFGMPYPGLQFPARILGVFLVVWWLMREWNDDDYPLPRSGSSQRKKSRLIDPVNVRRYARPWK